jgi:hypothetical protein
MYARMSVNMRMVAEDAMSRLVKFTTDQGDDVVELFQQLGPGDFLSDFTEDQVVGVIMFMNYIIDHVQYCRGMRHQLEGANS